MKERTFDVVAYIARRYGCSPAALDDPVEIREELLDAGFEEDDVERGIAWLRRLRGRGAVLGWSVAEALRPPTPEEAEKITAEARGFLLRLERGGLLDAALREAVYEKALAVDLREVGAEEVRVLAALVLQAAGADDRFVGRLLEGDVEGIYH